MFDVGFWELALVGVVALLVVGPDKLPGLARTVGLYVGRIRRMVAQVREDIEREVRADELKKTFQEGYRSLEATRDELHGGVTSLDEARIGGEASGSSAHGEAAERSSDTVPPGSEAEADAVGAPESESREKATVGEAHESPEGASTDARVERDERRVDP